MSVRANPTVIGAFVLGATIVLVAGLLFWGGTGLFRTKYRYVMYFDTAVTGLQKGAPLVAVYVALDPAVLKGVTPASVDAGIRSAIKERGLRGQVRMQSFVTGVLYVALDDFPGTPVMLRGFDTEVPELPTVPTDVEKWTAKIEKI